MKGIVICFVAFALISLSGLSFTICLKSQTLIVRNLSLVQQLQRRLQKRNQLPLRSFLFPLLKSQSREKTTMQTLLRKERLIHTLDTCICWDPSKITTRKGCGGRAMNLESTSKSWLIESNPWLEPGFLSPSLRCSFPFPTANHLLLQRLKERRMKGRLHHLLGSENRLLVVVMMKRETNNIPWRDCTYFISCVSWQSNTLSYSPFQ